MDLEPAFDTLNRIELGNTVGMSWVCITSLMSLPILSVAVHSTSHGQRLVEHHDKRSCKD